MGLRERLIEKLGGDEPLDPDAPVAVGPVPFVQSGLVSVALHDAGIRHRVTAWLSPTCGTNETVMIVVGPQDAARAVDVVDGFRRRLARAGSR